MLSVLTLSLMLGNSAPLLKYRAADGKETVLTRSVSSTPPLIVNFWAS